MRTKGHKSCKSVDIPYFLMPRLGHFSKLAIGYFFCTFTWQRSDDMRVCMSAGLSA